MVVYSGQTVEQAIEKGLKDLNLMTVIDVIAGMTGAIRSMYEERLGESRS